MKTPITNKAINGAILLLQSRKNKNESKLTLNACFDLFINTCKTLENQLIQTKTLLRQKRKECQPNTQNPSGHRSFD